MKAILQINITEDINADNDTSVINVTVKLFGFKIAEKTQEFKIY